MVYTNSSKLTGNAIQLPHLPTARYILITVLITSLLQRYYNSFEVIFALPYIEVTRLLLNDDFQILMGTSISIITRNIITRIVVGMKWVKSSLNDHCHTTAAAKK